MNLAQRSVWWAVVFAALWALVEALATDVLLHYSPYQIVWMRYGVHLAFMLGIWGWRQPKSLWHTRRPLFQLARSMLMLCMPACWITAIQVGVDPGALMAIFWSSPLLILVLARCFLAERVSVLIWALAAVAWFGIFLVFRPKSLPSLPSIIFPVGMALSFSLYVVMTRSLRTETWHANLFYSALGVFLALSPLMPQVWVTPSVHDVMVMLGVGVLGFGVLFAIDRLAVAAPVSVSAPVFALQVVFTIGIALALGHNHPTLRTALGLLVICMSAFYVWCRGSSFDSKVPA
ncbi:MAG: DMT family transporter [Gammaproteobacteria bacterium]|nr:DMT family transporter [Gammaproteobacteria bacterium]